MTAHDHSFGSSFEPDCFKSMSDKIRRVSAGLECLAALAMEAHGATPGTLDGIGIGAVLELLAREAYEAVQLADDFRITNDIG